MKTSAHIHVRDLRRSILYGLLGILALLLIAFTVNEKNWRPLKGKPQWIATSNYSPTETPKAIDRNPDTAWSTYIPMSSGMFFQLQLKAPTIINGVVLHIKKKEHSSSARWVVNVSSDGQVWHPLDIQKQLLYHSMFLFSFDSVEAQYLQITQIEGTPSSFPWTIYEIDILQPVLPWQFSRSTMIHTIALALLALISVPILWPSQRSPQHSASLQTVWRQTWLIPVLMIGILIIGWILRVYNIHVDRISKQDIYSVSLLDIENYTDAEWIATYFQYFGGDSWLSFLGMRWGYQIYKDYALALRIAPILFGVCSILGVFLVWKCLIRGEMVDDNTISPAPHLRKGRIEWQHQWGAVFASALASVSGLFVFLSRTGDFSMSLLFFILLYLLLVYHFLYRQGSYLWALVLSIMEGIAFFIDPAMQYVPIGALIFGGLHCLIRTTTLPPFCKGGLRGIFSGREEKPSLPPVYKERKNLKASLIRYSLYIASCLPLYIYIYWTFWQTENASISDFFTGAFHPTFRELSQALQFCGFAGIASWILGGITFVGLGQAIIQRVHSEWFFYCQAMLFFLLAPQKPASHGLLALGVLFLLTQGIMAFFSSLKAKHAKAFSSALYAAIFLYVGGFSINSLLVGNPVFPHAPRLLQQLTQARTIHEAIQQMRNDPNTCSTRVLLGELFTTLYTELYNVNVQLLPPSELQRLSQQGMLPAYIWTTLLDDQTLTPLLNDKYTLIGADSEMAVYALRKEFSAQPKRYYWQDLFLNTGKHIEDDRTSTGIARAATPGDPPGLLALTFGPFTRTCVSGRYTARFVLRLPEPPADDNEVVAILQVMADTHEVLARKELTGKDFSDLTTYYAMDLTFDLDTANNPAMPAKYVQCSVYVPGTAEMRLDYVELRKRNA